MVPYRHNTSLSLHSHEVKSSSHRKHPLNVHFTSQHKKKEITFAAMFTIHNTQVRDTGAAVIRVKHHTCIQNKQKTGTKKGAER